MVAWISALLIGVAAFLSPLAATAEEVRPRSILVLDQFDLSGPFYQAVFSGLRSVLSADSRSHVTLYTESLSISRTIVQAHKGRIWAENQREGGAVFRLSPPLALS